MVANPLIFLAPPRGFEPPTLGPGIRESPFTLSFIECYCVLFMLAKSRIYLLCVIIE